MKRFRVEWTERHEAEVEARDEEEAYQKAQSLDHEVTYKFTVYDDEEVLSGSCEEHNTAWFGDGSCPDCDFIDQSIDEARGK